ncbi:MAG: hypothetical protein ACI87W_000351 [Halieaceae bacterium]|jgi:hypothetical protein
MNSAHTATRQKLLQAALLAAALSLTLLRTPCVLAEEAPLLADSPEAVSEDSAPAPDSPQQEIGDSDASEVNRLRQLLQRYHSDNAIENPVVEAAPLLPRQDGAPGEAALQTQLARPFSPAKVLLPPEEVGLVITQIEQRLDDPLLEERRNSAPMICTVQTRRRGTLIAGTTHNMVHIGKYQFIGKLSVRGGTSTLSTADQRWVIELPRETLEQDYLVALHAPPLGDWEMHAMPLEAVRNLPDVLPDWLQTQLAGSTDTP